MNGTGQRPPYVRVPLFLFILSIIFLTIPAVQAATPDYTALKNDYIKNHPGQSIIPYPWEPRTSTKVLPVNYLVPAAPANNFSITACRGEYEAGSFVITSQKDHIRNRNQCPRSV